MLSAQYVIRHPRRSLTLAFIAWKTFLLAIAAGSAVGPTYDTSGGLLMTSASVGGPTSPVNGITQVSTSASLLGRLSSWDAVYFTQVARRGYLFEQEWAFGSGLPLTIAATTRGLEALGVPRDTVPAPFIGSLVAHISHLLSVLVLYHLGLVVLQGTRQGQRLALVAALLHVLSPGGLFLSAPYAESSFSLLSFTGYLLFVKAASFSSPSSPPSSSEPLPPSRLQPWSAACKDAHYLLAGGAFGLATLFRTNGILNGMLFALPFLRELIGLTRGRFALSAIRRLVVLGIGGLLVGAGSLVPQALAYQRYCCSGASGGGAPRPWCASTVPSIYNFVQLHYWNSGLFRYWTLSNLPLFLLGGPMLYVMFRSGVAFITSYPATADDDADVAATWRPTKPEAAAPAKPLLGGERGAGVGNDELVMAVKCMAAAQAALVLLTLLSYHVQIITRLSSGYPVWYWWAAGQLSLQQRDDAEQEGKKKRPGSGNMASSGSLILGFMVMYAVVQGVLFASFLPPA